jgi:hypothetical protein
MKKKVAVFTIVKNESFFLPIWIKHYSRFFNKEDLYVLDHQSTDGSTVNLDVNVVQVTNDLAFDHQWLVDTVQNFQVKLLESYECVIFAESDELLYSTDIPFTEFINKFIESDSLYLTCEGYEMIQDLENEPPLSQNDLIMPNRNYWFKVPHYDKTLISKIPLDWDWGFHFLLGKSNNFENNLFLCHLHRCDFELMLKRHEERAKKWNLKEDGPYAGTHHRIGDRDGVLKYFNEVASTVTEIPQSHKLALYGV